MDALQGAARQRLLDDRPDASLVQFVIRMVSEKSERNCSSRLRVILRHLSTHTLLRDERLSTALSTLREHLLDMAFRFWHGGFWILLHAL